MPPRRRKRTRNWTYFYRNAINAEFAATAEMIDSQANYLGRSHIWLATGIAYRAVRIAGAGSSGLITLFEKVRTNVGTRRRRADGNIVPNAPDRFIVKQVGTRNSAHLKEESNVMLTLQDPKAFVSTFGE
jgi:hypothetical protein